MSDLLSKNEYIFDPVIIGVILDIWNVLLSPLILECFDCNFCFVWDSQMTTFAGHAARNSMTHNIILFHYEISIQEALSALYGGEIHRESGWKPGDFIKNHIKSSNTNILMY